MRCVKCGEKTEVLETIGRGDFTRRRRRCLNPRCQHRFTTAEVAAERAREMAEGEALARLRKAKVTGFDAEAIAAALAVDRRKEQIRQRQRAQEQYDGEDDYPRRLSADDVRRIIRGA
jgi:transcriptional regulator NrdR family protein